LIYVTFHSHTCPLITHHTQLQAEIKIHRTLKHDNICEYKHFFEDRDNCYILLELCHNQSMNEMIKRRKQLTEPEAIFFMGQMLMAVRYMHDNNVIHRDLKLGNLFLDKHLNMKVGDLGLATRLEDKDEKRKTICGTPNYIAPEIIQGDKAKRGHSFEVDVWSMGVILYTLLVGKPPYEAKDVKATYQRIINNEYSFPKHTQVSDVAKDLIGCMLQSVPTERYVYVYHILSEIAVMFDDKPFLTFVMLCLFV
jgi:polo-like kinase 1